MPPETAVSMRRTKMKAEEVALIAGEITKPSWESRNEGIHERVSFEDTIWGFDLAGGSYYMTPLRVTFVRKDDIIYLDAIFKVKPGSRADKAGIRPGDRLLRINGVDTTTLTIQEAHDIILKAGLHLRLNVTSPDDQTDAYYSYEDPIIDEYEAEQERLRAEEAARRRQVHAKVNSYWSLQWPWVSKRRIIWRESNCFMVPSKYEEKHKDKFLSREAIRREDDVILDRVRKPSGRPTPPKFVRSKSYECTIDENALEEVNGESDNEETKINGQENGNQEESLENGLVNDDNNDSDVEENSVIENYQVDHNNNEIDDNNNVVETIENGTADEDREVNIEEISDQDDHEEQEEENKIEIRNVEHNEESKDIQDNGHVDYVSGNDDTLEEILKTGDGITKSEEDAVIENVLNGNSHEATSDITNER